MSKAILVMDMPNFCQFCPCFQGEDVLNAYCGSTSKVVIFDEQKGWIKPDWCPLKEAPEKYTDLVPTRDLHSGEYEYGWNACVDEILGE